LTWANQEEQRVNLARNQTEAAECRLLQPGEAYIGKQGLQYQVAISAETVGARAIHMQLVTIPPRGRAKAHKHATHETAIYALSGASGVWHGERLEHHTVVKPGEFFYIPADMPHLPYNPSDSEPVIAVIARTDPNEQESVVLLPELDSIHPA
jgi:uncharacterized RmlC-like cupin family protein